MSSRKKLLVPVLVAGREDALKVVVSGSMSVRQLRAKAERKTQLKCVTLRAQLDGETLECAREDLTLNEVLGGAWALEKCVWLFEGRDEGVAEDEQVGDDHHDDDDVDDDDEGEKEGDDAMGDEPVMQRIRQLEESGQLNLKLMSELSREKLQLQQQIEKLVSENRQLRQTNEELCAREERLRESEEELTRLKNKTARMSRNSASNSEIAILQRENSQLKEQLGRYETMKEELERRGDSSDCVIS